ncbi:DUF1254 domain-containing protein [Sandaracinobacteroides hominis]|uniref:DUF1254 domain-containing protein n=1 Tax=Sandaracinobacteroides hominis TaxID=2780086 RepID=UPI0018F27E78|nr:DUF1254 domain-containing protein [Sandaracinobacteroides hominis]
MRKLLIGLLLLALFLVGGWLWIRGPIAETTTAALRAYPIYSVVRTRNESILRSAHAGVSGSNRLIHRTDLAGPRDRWVTTPNNDTLYSSAFLDLASGPVELTIPKGDGRYFSVAVMDFRSDNNFVLRETDGDGKIRLEFGDGKTGALPPAADGTRRYAVSTNEAWLLIRTLVDGAEDLPAARAVQQGFVLGVPPASVRPPREAVVLPVLPGPDMLLRRTNPVVAENPHLQDKSLASTGYGLGPDAFDNLPLWRQWLWRALLPRIYERMKEGISAGSRITGDGWSKSPAGIGTAEASDAVRAGVALGGLAALPVTEAVYWSATQDSSRQELDGAKSYALTIPAHVPVDAFWSISMYERLPDGRLFYVENPINRYAVGNRTPGLKKAADGSLTLVMSPTDPGPEANWLPTPPKAQFTLIFRGYRPQAPIRSGEWRLPLVERDEP